MPKGAKAAARRPIALGGSPDPETEHHQAHEIAKAVRKVQGEAEDPRGEGASEARILRQVKERAEVLEDGGPHAQEAQGGRQQRTNGGRLIQPL